MQHTSVPHRANIQPPHHIHPRTTAPNKTGASNRTATTTATRHEDDDRPHRTRIRISAGEVAAAASQLASRLTMHPYPKLTTSTRTAQHSTAQHSLHETHTVPKQASKQARETTSAPPLFLTIVRYPLALTSCSVVRAVRASNRGKERRLACRLRWAKRLFGGNRTIKWTGDHALTRVYGCGAWSCLDAPCVCMYLIAVPRRDTAQEEGQDRTIVAGDYSRENRGKSSDNVMQFGKSFR